MLKKQSPSIEYLNKILQSDIFNKSIPDKFLSEINNINLLENVFLISGNEPGLISGVERKIIDIVSKKNNEAVDLEEINHGEKRELSERLNSSSLFSS